MGHKSGLQKVPDGLLEREKCEGKAEIARSLRQDALTVEDECGAAAKRQSERGARNMDEVWAPEGLGQRPRELSHPDGVRCGGVERALGPSVSDEPGGEARGVVHVNP